jgi:hypothetical protein
LKLNNFKDIKHNFCETSTAISLSSALEVSWSQLTYTVIFSRTSIHNYYCIPSWDMLIRSWNSASEVFWSELISNIIFSRIYKYYYSFWDKFVSLLNKILI